MSHRRGVVASKSKPLIDVSIQRSQNLPGHYVLHARMERDGFWVRESFPLVDNADLKDVAETYRLCFESMAWMLSRREDAA